MAEDSPRAPGVDSALASQWAQVRGRLRTEFGEATFRSWLKPLTLVGQHEDAVNIAVKTRFMRDWITQHYAERIRSLWHAANPDIRSIELVVDASRPQAMKAQSLPVDRPAEAGAVTIEVHRGDGPRGETARPEHPRSEHARLDHPRTEHSNGF